jgi:ribose-phosphate pyrophosphokinase
MKLKLDLTNVLNSDIGFKTSQYPDGQQSISIDYFDSRQSVRISSRMNSFKDVELIICTNQVLKEYGVNNIELYVPYFLGGRSDRKFGTTDTNYLKNVICPIINSQGFSKVIVLDPHSDVLEACLTNFVKINNFDLVKYSLTDIDNKNDARERICLVSPDAGAYKKIFDVANRFEINKVVTANKVRDMKTGNIIRTELPTMDLRGIEHLIVIDDICDGGRTFIELAKAIKEITEIPIYLIVTHGIFSAGYFELGKYFSGIYTTNSIKDIDTDIALVKQLNIF